MQTLTTRLATCTVTMAAGALVVGVQEGRTTYPGRAGRIAFPATIGRNTDIYSALPDGTQIRRLTTSKGFDACPRYAPTGQLLVFCSDRSGRYQIWAMRVDGGGQRRLTAMRFGALFPDVSADGRQVAFQASDGSPAADDVYVVRIRGGKPRRLTGAPGNDDYPAFSPDGLRIAFVSHRKGPGQIWVMDADGRKQRQLTRDAVAKDQRPDWSPDGTRIAYEAGGDIWVMNADGSRQRNLTHDGVEELGPAWSPDGTRIAFVARENRRLVYVMEDRKSTRLNSITDQSRMPSSA